MQATIRWRPQSMTWSGTLIDVKVVANSDHLSRSERCPFVGLAMALLDAIVPRQSVSPSSSSLFSWWEPPSPKQPLGLPPPAPLRFTGGATDPRPQLLAYCLPARYHVHSRPTRAAVSMRRVGLAGSWWLGPWVRLEAGDEADRLGEGVGSRRGPP